MAGFWNKDKKKGKKDKGQNKFVLPDMPNSVANPGGGLKGAIEPLKPLLSDEPVSARSEDATIQLDNDTKMGLRGASDTSPSPASNPAPNPTPNKDEPAAPASDVSADAPYDENEETMVLGKGGADNEPVAQTSSPAYDASDEETMIFGRGQAQTAPEPEPEPEAVVEPEPEPEPEPEATPAPIKAEEEITKPDTVIRPSRSQETSIEDDPLSRVKTLSPKLMADASKYENILPSGDDEEEDTGLEPDVEEDAALDGAPEHGDGQDMQSDLVEEDETKTDIDREDEPAPVSYNEAEQITPVSMVKKSGVQSEPIEDEATRIFGSRPRTNKPIAPLTDVKVAGVPKKEEPVDAMSDPVVGWLVIVDGPGVGTCLPLGYGTNPIGRASELRVALTFGDAQVSRGTHATVIYDPRGREFYVQHGGGTNLTYLDNKPLLEPKQLTARDRITIGDTVLMLIPLCDENFDWQDLNDE